MEVKLNYGTKYKLIVSFILGLPYFDFMFPEMLYKTLQLANVTVVFVLFVLISFSVYNVYAVDIKTKGAQGLTSRNQVHNEAIIVSEKLRNL